MINDIYIRNEILSDLFHNLVRSGIVMTER